MLTVLSHVRFMCFLLLYVFCSIKFAICTLIIHVCTLILTISQINFRELDQITKMQNFNLVKISRYTEPQNGKNFFHKCFCYTVLLEQGAVPCSRYTRLSTSIILCYFFLGVLRGSSCGTCLLCVNLGTTPQGHVLCVVLCACVHCAQACSTPFHVILYL